MNITTQKIAGILKKAGYDAAQTFRSSQVRGWVTVSRTGFRTMKVGSTIQVQVLASTRNQQRDQEFLAGYLKALTEAGLTVTTDVYGRLNIEV